MHNAPSVSYPLGRSRIFAALLLAFWLLGGVATALFWFQAPSPNWRHGAAWLVLAAAGALAAWHWWRGPLGMLGWDGESWNWSDAGVEQSGVIEVSVDMQHWLLLRWTAGSASRWLWLARADHAERWRDLRRAVYSRARPEALPEAGRLAAKP